MHPALRKAKMRNIRIGLIVGTIVGVILVIVVWVVSGPSSSSGGAGDWMPGFHYLMGK
jgi:hypothetical protein